MSTLLLILGLAPAAEAFCGHYVGQAGSQIYNQSSQVVVVRQGEQTTLTLANDVQGDTADFALVMPVPQVLTADDVQTVDPEVLRALDAYSAPRLVTYECDDFNYYSYSDGGGGSDSGTSGGEGDPATDGVVVEATFTEGEFLIQVLSADAAEPLVNWLNENGYEMSPDAETLLGEYISEGSYFVAARVILDENAEAPTYLTPLQFTYTSSSFSLPIRLGTLNSQGVQDLIIYALTDYEKGAVAISNSAYPQLSVESDCMWRGSEEPEASFGGFYVEQLDAALSGTAAGWLTEYSWATGGCDPCSGEPPTDEQVTRLGYAGGAGEAYFTRLHVRYTADGATEDLMLYETNIQDFDQIKFIGYRYELEDRFPICGEGMAEEPGSCDEAGGEGDASGGDDDGGSGSGSPVPDPNGFDLADTVKEPTGCAYGCAASGDGAGGLAGLGLFAGLALAARRRRSV
jgi:uncharacterized protein (TIGR03382 family)